MFITNSFFVDKCINFQIIKTISRYVICSSKGLKAFNIKTIPSYWMYMYQYTVYKLFVKKL